MRRLSDGISACVLQCQDKMLGVYVQTYDAYHGHSGWHSDSVEGGGILY